MKTIMIFLASSEELTNDRNAFGNEYVSFIDLRWGTDMMTDSTERRILDSCFKEIENQLGSDSLSYYAICCFNLGQIAYLYTTGRNEVGLPLVESAVNIMGRLVNNYGLSKYERDLVLFNQQHYALKNRRN